MTAIAPRRMEQSIFKTIVEMANEMNYHQEREDNLKRIAQHIQDIPHIHSILNTGNLRSLHAKPTKGHDHFTKPFKWANREYRVAVYMEYARYEDEQGKVREKGIVTMSPQYKPDGSDIWREVHRLIWVRKEYLTLEEFPNIMENLTRSAVELFWLHL